MNALATKSFDEADETRQLEKTTIDVAKIGDHIVARFTFQPGWKWSECVGPAVGTPSCQATHLGAAVSGRMHVVTDDGARIDVAPGQAYAIPPGHDAWVVGDEPFVGLEFQSGATYGTKD